MTQKEVIFDGPIMTWFRENTVPVADLLRLVIPPDLLVYAFVISFVIGMLSFFASYLSFMRIRYSMKRDGKNPPAIFVVWGGVEYFLLCSRSQKKLKKRMEAEAENEGETMSNWGYLSTTEALPYVKPIDRFLARAAYLFPLGVIC